MYVFNLHNAQVWIMIIVACLAVFVSIYAINVLSSNTKRVLGASVDVKRAAAVKVAAEKLARSEGGNPERPQSLLGFLWKGAGRCGKQNQGRSHGSRGTAKVFHEIENEMRRDPAGSASQPKGAH